MGKGLYEALYWLK
jgi:hypothetical protein